MQNSYFIQVCQNEKRGLFVFDDIEGIINHHCLNFLSKQNSNMKL